jgi:hypothetical protein
LFVAACLKPGARPDEGQRPGAAPGGAKVETGAGARPGGLLVTLPAVASEAASLREPKSGVTAEFRLAEGREVPASLSGTEASYEGALGAGTTLLLRTLGRGVEDLVQFAARPAREEVSYLLATRGFAGLRSLGRTVELLDESGAPRLRVEPPTITGADGRVVQASLEVGCAHDRSPVGPWGRPVTPPGADECRLTVRWEGQGVTYPAVLDPTWSGTADMSVGRAYPGFTLIDGNRVLVAGGVNCPVTCPALTSAEIYDVASGTWGMTSDMNLKRAQFQMGFVPGKGVLAPGGDTGPTTTDASDFYDLAQGTWTALPPMSTKRSDAPATLSADGKTMIVTGGAFTQQMGVSNIDLLDLATMQWSDGGQLQQGRFLHSANLLNDGTVLIAGGTTCTTFNCAKVFKSAEIYDLTTKTSKTVAPLATARGAHAAGVVKIDGEDVTVVTGGGTKTTEYYVPSMDVWLPLPPMQSDRIFTHGQTLPDNSFLVVGGAATQLFVGVALTERLDPVAKTWSTAGSLATARSVHALVLLPDGRVLAAGGLTSSILSAGTPATATTELFQVLSNGAACVGNGECASLHCADGVCCDTACDGECVSCIAAQKSGGVDGTCGPVAVDTDPSGECPDLPVVNCSNTGMCDGKGACAHFAMGTICDGGTCASGVAITHRCAGEGNCMSMTEACEPYFCQDPTVCASSCENDSQCVAGSHCLLDSKTCEGNRPPGAMCKKSSECGSNFCVDGVCCSTPCDGVCQACAAATKESGVQSGLCGPAKHDTDPHETCATEPTRNCGQSGVCNSKGSCALYASGTKCLDPDCSGSKQTELKGNEYSCDGMGTCSASKSSSCGLFICDSGACTTSCTDDKGCVEHAYCDKGTCHEKKALSGACSASRECTDGFCVDGVCCNSPCEGTCESCNQPNAAGFCIPVTGSPAHGRPACPVASPTTPCKQLTCDGTTRDQCVGFVGPTVPCREAACTAGIATSTAVCDGKGNCAEQDGQKCEPFVCLGAACGAACASDAECAAKFQCDPVKHDCVPRTGASCDGDHTLSTPGGQTTDCSPYKCEGASCKSGCTSVLDCVAPNICDEATRACIGATPNPDTAAGCAAFDGGPRSSSSPLALLAALALAARVARRPRARRAA